MVGLGDDVRTLAQFANYTVRDFVAGFVMDLMFQACPEIHGDGAQLDLDPREFLYWLAHREDYGTDDERACAAIMDACFARLYEEKQGELLGALLSGDQKTFELFRTEAPELRHLPAATYEWYSKNYLDRDYPLRFILMCNGVEFPDTPEEDK